MKRCPRNHEVEAICLTIEVDLKLKKGSRVHYNFSSNMGSR